MKKIIIRKGKIWAVIAALFFWLGCEDFLDTQPYGTTSLRTLSQQTSGAEVLLIAAYSQLDGVSESQGNHWGPSGAASNWIFGSIAGGDAYKGSTVNDQAPITSFEIHESLNANNVYLIPKWTMYFKGIARANDALEAFRSLNGISDSFRKMRMAEARFLRGFYHFELRKIFGKVPYLDEMLDDTRVGNQDNILPKIQDDFSYASAHLLKTMEQPGRATKGAAQAYLGITKMWEQDWSSAKIYFDSVITSGRYHLNPTYHDNFNAEVRNSPESILEVQLSVNDGGQGSNGSSGDWLNYPFAPGYCCGFHQPSQNLVNAFKTDATGLPLLDSYNDPGTDVSSDEGMISADPSFTPYTGNLDPRLDWTVGRRGIPYLDWGKHPGRDWIRNQDYAGPYSPKKNVIYQSQQSEYADNSSWITSFNANNLKLLRYADLLLYTSEAEVELGNLTNALELVNKVRARAAKPEGFVMDGTVPAATYRIIEYPPFPNQVYAREAVRFERRLELGMEGHRFFDMVRWGIAAEEKTAYFEVEKTKRIYLAGAAFKKGVNEYLPIPQIAIDLSYKNGKKTLFQNNGY